MGDYINVKELLDVMYLMILSCRNDFRRRYTKN